MTGRTNADSFEKTAKKPSMSENRYQPGLMLSVFCALPNTRSERENIIAITMSCLRSIVVITDIFKGLSRNSTDAVHAANRPLL